MLDKMLLALTEVVHRKMRIKVRIRIIIGTTIGIVIKREKWTDKEQTLLMLLLSNIQQQSNIIP